MLINEQTRRYNEKMEEIEQLEYAEALAVNQLKLKRQNTVRKKNLAFSGSSVLDSVCSQNSGNSWTTCLVSQDIRGYRREMHTLKKKSHMDYYEMDCANLCHFST